MATGVLDNVQAKEKDAVILGGTVVIGAAGAITSENLDGVAVARTGTGQYTLTTDHRFNSMVFGMAQYATSGAAATDRTCTFDLDYDNSTGEVIVQALNAGAAADPTSGHGFHVLLVMKASTV